MVVDAAKAAESAIETGCQEAFIAGWTGEENPQAPFARLAHSRHTERPIRMRRRQDNVPSKAANQVII
jgi:hypothetical protein